MEIELHPIDELISEIKRRYPDGTLIALQNPDHEVRSTGNEWRTSMAGKVHVTLKLASVCMWHHQIEIMKSARPDPQDGEL
jgi:hypothetical protein